MLSVLDPLTREAKEFAVRPEDAALFVNDDVRNGHLTEKLTLCLVKADTELNKLPVQLLPSDHKESRADHRVNSRENKTGDPRIRVDGEEINVHDHQQDTHIQRHL